MYKIALTGATGFIGKYLRKELLATGYSVLCLTRNKKSLSKLDNNTKNIVTNFTKEELVIHLKDCDILIHLAARRMTRSDPQDMIYPFIEDSAKMIDNILYACKKNNINRIITASSIGVYSDFNSSPYSEKDYPKPATLYGLSKYFLEQRVDFFARKYNASVAHIRLAQCYGYGEKNTPAIMKFIEKALSKDKIILENGGLYQIDEVYIKDAINAFMLLIKKNKSGVFNIGGGKGYSILEIARTVNEVFDNKNNLEILPKQNEVLSKHMDINKAKLELKWEPRFSLKEGLEDIKKLYNEDNKNENT